MINWAALQQGGGFENALSTGFQMGTVARERQEQREFRNALAQFDPSKPETLDPIMQARPEVGMQLRGQVQQQQAVAMEGELTSRALQGDEQALDQLARLNFDKWAKIDTRQKTAAAEETKMFGQVALSLSQIPYEQRRDQILALAQRMPQYADKINEIAFLPQAEQDNLLRVAITEAGIIDRLIALEQPQQFNVGPGEGRYEIGPDGQVRTVIQPNYGGAAPFSPVPQGGAPSVSDIEAELRRRGVLR